MTVPMNIHTYFNLTYANYKVLHRTLLQSMPEDWQERFVGMLRELDAAFSHVEQAPGYDVQPCRWVYANELTEAEMRLTGVTYSADFSEDADADDEATYHDRDGNELDSVSRVAVPDDEPIPHYQRGRARVEPNLDAMRAQADTP